MQKKKDSHKGTLQLYFINPSRKQRTNKEEKKTPKRVYKMKTIKKNSDLQVNKKIMFFICLPKIVIWVCVVN
jgi:hypothetical protein